MKLNEKQFNILAGGLIVLAALIIYSNTFQVPFQFDDIYHIQQKPLIQNLKNFTKISAWTDIGSRPVPMFTLALNYHWGEVTVTGYHIANLLFHIITGWTVYLLTLQLLSLRGLKTRDWLKDNRQYFSLLVALLFVAHPMQTQAVTYIIQRITSLATLFYLLAVYTYIKARLSHLEKGMGQEAIRYYCFTLISFILALLSKQIAVTLPLTLILTEAFFIRDKDGNLQKKFLYILSATVGAGIFLGLLLVGLPRETNEFTRGVYFMTSLKVLVKYIQMMVLPVAQNIDHDIKASGPLFGLYELVSLIILLGLVYLGYVMFKKDRLISFGIFWYFITLSVESSVIPIRDFMFEHRMYLPGFGFFLAATVGLSYIPALMRTDKIKIPAILALLAALVLAAGYFAHARNNVWQSALSLWSDSVEKSPGKARPWMWQGIAYSDLKDYTKAKECFDKCIELMPGFSMAYFNRGNIYKELEENKKAIEDYTKSIELRKDYELAYFNRGVVRAKVGQKKEAVKDYTEAIRLNPENELAFYNRGNAFRTMHNYPEAINDYDQAILLKPDYALAIYNRGLTKAALDRHTEAIADFDKAISLDPQNYLFYNGKGVSLHALNLFREAIVSYNTSISLKPQFGQAYYNKAYTEFFGLNEREAACQDWQMALQYNYKQAEKMMRDHCQRPAPQIRTNADE